MGIQQQVLMGFLLTFAVFSASAEPIATITIVAETQPERLTLDAQLEATKAATVSAQTSGRIIKINYDVNDIVPQGAALLEITSKAQGAELAAAEAEYAKAVAQNEEAQKQRSRYAQLFPQGAISQGDMDQVIANARATAQAVSAAKARIVQANESLQYTVVSAPFSGVVTQRYVEQGETVAPGQALLSGFSTEQMRAVTYIPLRYLDALRAQSQVKISLNDGQQLLSDKFTIFSFADPSSHSYKARIDLPKNQPNLMPGMWVKAQFITGERSVITVPKSAISFQNEMSAVYLQQHGSYQLSQIRLGTMIDGQYEVLSGLTVGDVIAADAYQVLLNLDK
ncbi:efflux RND transporter periplasmic adaptor subunit [Shewanella sp. Isolate11]|uniref:efflux RND transporter periplasmic adaptor subunit n=1 Tax=Shewanella sp. Isolate11 TaxID=2908530 RepID=UPI001EFC6B4B|nr:efflux RND transporter periplasmic adaptor subunit [Shewanella sp. Isolate11]MCG9696282.1 efflux RND transporter periplasmic adaptor subunit [Shewanella sp. Isolate11]